MELETFGVHVGVDLFSFFCLKSDVCWHCVESRGQAGPIYDVTCDSCVSLSFYSEEKSLLLRGGKRCQSDTVV